MRHHRESLSNFEKVEIVESGCCVAIVGKCVGNRVGNCALTKVSLAAARWAEKVTDGLGRLRHPGTQKLAHHFTQNIQAGMLIWGPGGTPARGQLRAAATSRLARRNSGSAGSWWEKRLLL